ncbi:ABC transporter ATP-binding protein [Nonomuraea sp. NPDC050404]|uniref:ABC transporter ATP-binding protein n=1 Tax=Nonomuraea sp. NPDC050404 TaxID=3155783 RepID=UPI0033EF23A4
MTATEPPDAERPVAGGEPSDARCPATASEPPIRDSPPSARGLLTRVLRRNARAVAASFALLAVWQLSEAMVPVVAGRLIDHAVVTGSAGALLAWGSLLAVVFASLMFFFRYGALIAYRIDQMESHRIRTEIARHVLRPLGARTGRLPGATLSLATADADGVGTLAQSAGYTFASAAAVAASGVVLLRIDVVVGLTVLLGVPLVLLLTQSVTPAISRRSRDQRGRIADTSAAAADLVRGLRVIKGLGAEDEAAARYRRRSQVAKTAGIRVAGSQALLKAVSTALSGLFLAGVALLAGTRALEHAISIGDLIAIVGLTQFYAGPIQTLGQVGALVADGHASASRIAAFLRTPPLLTAGTAHPTLTTPTLTTPPRTTPPRTTPTLTLEKVSAGALHDFSLISRPGELLCLAVDDPAATTDLLRLLSGEIPAQDVAGDVRLEGTAINELSVAARGERLLVNPHHSDLLAGTLRGNLDPDTRHDDAHLTRILGVVAAHDIMRLHDSGLDQPVTARGGTYSGGQRQRIALARALTADPPILVLDHPTSAVDAMTEQRIALGLRAARHRSGSRTTWIVTTSPALLAQADRVAYVTAGRVTGTGTHRELLSRPDYADLVLR